MRAGTTINIIDNSSIQQPVSSIAAADTTTPLFGVIISSDKGSEEPGVYMGSDFFDMFGSEESMKNAYKKHGQPLLQAAAIINAGGKLFVKRLVDPDATLANIIVVAKVSQSSVQKVNSEGEALYEQEDGTEGTTVTDEPVMDIKAVIKYELHSATNAKTMADVKALITSSKLYVNTLGEDDTSYSYPIAIITDVGRGVSSKKFKMVTDYITSKTLSFAVSNFSVIENNKTLEATRFSMNPNIVYKDTSYELSVQCKSYMKQVNVYTDSDYVNEFFAKVSELANMDAADVYGIDLIKCCNRKGEPLTSLILDDESVDLSSEYGIELTNGDNGNFGDSPFGTAAYVAEGVKYLSGQLGAEIYDRSTYKVAAWFDANYPDDWKRKLEVLGNWRKDGMVYTDMGLDVYSFDDVQTKAANINRSFYNSTYCTAYDVYDPYSRKAVPVTMMYSFAPLMVALLRDNPQNPPMGSANNMIITNAIEGTLKYKPVETPTVEEKTLLEDLRVNYATYVEGQLVPETGYTSQEAFTQLSFSNNVVALQEVGRALRKACPPERYKILDSDGLKSYEDAARLCVNSFASWFNSIEFVYTMDPIMKSNKVFNASVSYSFYDFFQTEQFDFYAINAE